MSSDLLGPAYVAPHTVENRVLGTRPDKSHTRANHPHVCTISLVRRYPHALKLFSNLTLAGGTPLPLPTPV